MMTQEAGFYQVDVDLSEKTYKLTPFNIGIIGNATSKGWDGEMRFRANDDWDLSWGGELDNLTTQNGPNIAVAAGTYDIKLEVNWAEGFAKCVMTKK